MKITVKAIPSDYEAVEWYHVSSDYTSQLLGLEITHIFIPTQWEEL